MPLRPYQDYRRYVGKGSAGGSGWTTPAWLVGVIWIAVSAMHVAYERGVMWWVWLSLGVFWVIALPSRALWDRRTRRST